MGSTPPPKWQNAGLGWDPLQKMVHSPGGDWPASGGCRLAAR